MNMEKNPVHVDQSIRDNQWVYKIQNGDENGFEELYRFYYPRLMRLACKYNSSKTTAEDLVHNVFHNVWKNRSHIKNNGKLRAYLYTAVRNQSIKHSNRKKRERYAYTRVDEMSFLESKEVNPLEHIGGKEFERAVEKAIQELPEKRREVFLMSREANLTYREIAEILNISIKTVETQMSRSLKFLRLELAQYLPERNRRNEFSYCT
ncbi:RNA polymerase sigma factor [Rhodohalobacter sp. 614A]|uniref:RNA polymerase sigma factor n=1 Tax=Rhodohalobacter sp. 614A TaxID=2908649 RepID=UPI001F3C9BF2|nr:RNA polymerase sigma-70 factor [Rhodohalobacter sp. 614A]